MKRINLRIEDDLFNQLDEKRFKMKTSFQAVGLELLNAWLTDRKTPAPVTGKNKQLAMEFAEWIGEPGDGPADEALKSAVRKILEQRQKGKK